MRETANSGEEGKEGGEERSKSKSRTYLLLISFWLLLLDLRRSILSEAWLTWLRRSSSTSTVGLVLA